MSIITSISSNDERVVLCKMDIWIGQPLTGTLVTLNTQDYKSWADIKPILIKQLSQMQQQGPIQYTSTYQAISYIDYVLVMQLRQKNQKESCFFRQICPLERPLEIKSVFKQANNSKQLDAYFVFMQRSAALENALDKQQFQARDVDSSTAITVVRNGKLEKLKKNEKFSVVDCKLWSNHLEYVSVKAKIPKIKTIFLADSDVQVLLSFKFKNCFQLISHKIYTFRASSKTELTAWQSDIQRCNNNLHDQKQLEDMNKTIMDSSSSIQSWLTGIIESSPQSCFRCLKMKTFREQFYDYLQSESERCYVSQNGLLSHYQCILSVMKVVDFIAITPLTFPPSSDSKPQLLSFLLGLQQSSTHFAIHLLDKLPHLRDICNMENENCKGQSNVQANNSVNNESNNNKDKRSKLLADGWKVKNDYTYADDSISSSDDSDQDSFYETYDMHIPSKQFKKQSQAKDIAIIGDMVRQKRDSLIVNEDIFKQQLSKAVSLLDATELLSLLLGFIETQAFSLYTNSGLYFTQVVKSVQKASAQALSNFKPKLFILCPSHSLSGSRSGSSSAALFSGNTGNSQSSRQVLSHSGIAKPAIMKI